MEGSGKEVSLQKSDIPGEKPDEQVLPDEHQADSAFEMKECKEALEDASLPLNKEPHDSDEEQFSDATAVPDNVEFDEAHMKQLYDNLPEEQLEECKKESTSLKNKGNEEYKNKNFKEAISLYTQALNSCPVQFTTERSILYANRAAAYVSMEVNETAVADCNKALELNPEYLKARLRRAQLHRKMNNLEQCLEDYKKILEMDQNNREAREACAVLPNEINERNEKLKAEMIGKLKDLGNLVLRPFGLSTENFKVEQDPNSGGYSINFQNNPK